MHELHLSDKSKDFLFNGFLMAECFLCLKQKFQILVLLVWSDNLFSCFTEVIMCWYGQIISLAVLLRSLAL